MESTILSTTVTPTPAGLVKTLQTTDQKNFTLTLTGLQARTTYTFEVIADANIRSNLAAGQTTFTTQSSTGGGGGPPPQGQNSPLRVTVERNTFHWDGGAATTMSASIALRNTGSSTVANVVVVPSSTTLQVVPLGLLDPNDPACTTNPERTSATCSPVEPTSNLTLGSIPVGSTSAQFTLRFPAARETTGFGVNARLRIAVTYDGLVIPFELLPEVKPNLRE